MNNNWEKFFSAFDYINKNYEVDIIYDSDKIHALLLDLAPDFNREAKAFLNVLSERELIKKLQVGQDISIKKVSYQIQDAFGLSDIWAENMAIGLFRLLGKEIGAEISQEVYSETLDNSKTVDKEKNFFRKGLDKIFGKGIKTGQQQISCDSLSKPKIDEKEDKINFIHSDNSNKDNLENRVISYENCKLQFDGSYIHELKPNSRYSYLRFFKEGHVVGTRYSCKFIPGKLMEFSNIHQFSKESYYIGTYNIIKEKIEFKLTNYNQTFDFWEGILQGNKMILDRFSDIKGRSASNLKYKFIKYPIEYYKLRLDGVYVYELVSGLRISLRFYKGGLVEGILVLNNPQKISNFQCPSWYPPVRDSGIYGSYRVEKEKIEVHFVYDNYRRFNYWGEILEDGKIILNSYLNNKLSESNLKFTFIESSNFYINVFKNT